tara:strand:+ start:877 stop:3261 length:2385 start_codon:yes stop_codon:yes gene_type:complete
MEDWSFARRAAVSRGIELLHHTKMRGVVDIVRKCVPGLARDGEINIDINTLPVPCLEELEAYIARHKKGARPAARSDRQPLPLPMATMPTATAAPDGFSDEDAHRHLRESYGFAAGTVRQLACMPLQRDGMGAMILFARRFCSSDPAERARACDDIRVSQQATDVKHEPESSDDDDDDSELRGIGMSSFLSQPLHPDHSASPGKRQSNQILEQQLREEQAKCRRLQEELIEVRGSRAAAVGMNAALHADVSALSEQNAQLSRGLPAEAVERRCPRFVDDFCPVQRQEVKMLCYSDAVVLADAMVEKSIGSSKTLREKMATILRLRRCKGTSGTVEENRSEFDAFCLNRVTLNMDAVSRDEVAVQHLWRLCVYPAVDQSLKDLQAMIPSTAPRIPKWGRKLAPSACTRRMQYFFAQRSADTSKPPPVSTSMTPELRMLALTSDTSGASSSSALAAGAESDSDDEMPQIQRSSEVVPVPVVTHVQVQQPHSPPIMYREEPPVRSLSPSLQARPWLQQRRAIASQPSDANAVVDEAVREPDQQFVDRLDGANDVVDDDVSEAPCTTCNKPGWLYLCDRCNKPFHFWCVREEPPTEANWYCGPCATEIDWRPPTPVSKLELSCSICFERKPATHFGKFLPECPGHCREKEDKRICTACIGRHVDQKDDYNHVACPHCRHEKTHIEYAPGQVVDLVHPLDRQNKWITVRRPPQQPELTVEELEEAEAYENEMTFLASRAVARTAERHAEILARRERARAAQRERQLQREAEKAEKKKQDEWHDAEVDNLFGESDGDDPW